MIPQLMPTLDPFPRARAEQATEPTVLAGDRERQRTADVLGLALAQGYLDMVEYERRLTVAFAAHTNADLRAVTADLPVSALRRNDPARHAANQAAARKSVRLHLAAYAAMAVIVLAVWLSVGLTAGEWYFWPVWPILGGAIGLISHAAPVRLLAAARPCSARWVTHTGTSTEPPP